ncbi:uncharacterized protein EAF01_004553 [Botrytis porri]|uniref:Major facilitator superfamily (MFS) profile domain-containing protein n=1 Tax=Botrytis porri TaxID=87229 RepID=A0A4Z1KD23_9HELO|nr:uncharacterized protein EAF01_004553 [Botrytis porri]KAF7906966.1 hypothetical protein EAF01_004553 [Botrytis porri]TGO83540.1 hypothetical protein BPOR_0630g00090 [Botrytis porri]
MVTVTLTRPIRMLFFELIALAACTYLALAYGIFYLYFEAYPIIFKGIYGQSSGVSGLMFLPIGGGATLNIIVSLLWDTFLRKHLTKFGRKKKNAYEVFAASAMAASSCCRSLAGAVSPFVTKPMYTKLGVPWAIFRYYLRGRVVVSGLGVYFVRSLKNDKLKNWKTCKEKNW